MRSALQCRAGLRDSVLQSGSGMRQRIRATVVALALAWLLAAPGLAQSVELQPETRSAFDQYVVESERSMQAELRPGGPFLLPDAWPPERREQAYQRLRHGDLIIERVDAPTSRRLNPGKPAADADAGWPGAFAVTASQPDQHRGLLAREFSGQRHLCVSNFRRNHRSWLRSSALQITLAAPAR